MTVENIREKIVNGETALGIELGSTRIKGVLLTSEIETIAVGSYVWENKLENGVWTYDLAEAWKGVQTCFANLAQEVKTKYDVELKRIGSIGISAMMHGYLAFDAKDELLVPFRTWRNNITGEAADYLTKALEFNIPQRWSVAHIYQAVLNKEPHVPEIKF